MTPSSIASLTLAALIGATLVGCDAAEESAQKLTEKAGEAAQALARDAISDTVNALNEQIDQAQQSTNELLGQPEKEAENREPKDDDEAPAASAQEGIET